MVRVLFVCHGNICRSPMAEYVLKDMVKKRGVADSFFIDSAATTSDDIGKPPHRNVRELLSGLNIEFEDKRARKIQKYDYDNYDYIIGMDTENMTSLKQLFKEDPANKIHRLLEFADMQRDVADPWFTHNFDRAYNDIVLGCNAFLEKLNE